MEEENLGIVNADAIVKILEERAMPDLQEALGAGIDPTSFVIGMFVHAFGTRKIDGPAVCRFVEANKEELLSLREKVS